MSEHKNRENVLDSELTVPDWPTGGLYTQPSITIPIIRHTDMISLSDMISTDIFLQIFC